MADTMDFAKVWGSNSPLAKYEFTNENYLMGWNFVGSVPPSRIMWDSWMRNADLKMQWLYNNAFSEDSLGGFLFWRLPNTAYFVNDLRCLQEGPINLYLKCTVAGMSSGERITKLPENKRVGEAWQDGTVTWEIMQFSSSADMEKAVSAHNNNTNAHKDFTGATLSEMGTRGMVPAPGKGANDRFLCADGSFKKAAMTTLEIVNIIYPVGSVITLTNDTDPNKLYKGTTWVKMDAGRVLISAGTYTEGSGTYTYNLGDKGGEAKHKLTTNEIPSHGHGASASTDSHAHTAWTVIGGSDFLGGHSNNNGKWGNTTTSQNSHSHSINISATGGNGYHENRPPYVVVNRWKRTV